MSFLQDKAQFEAAFRAHYRSLVAYAARMLGDRDQAEDTVQQVFVSIWERRDQREEPANTVGYLMRSVHNACLNTLQHEKVKGEHKAHILSSPVDNHWERALETEEFKQLLRRGVQRLPTECRRVFLMSRAEGLKYQQIADKLGISVKTVENQMGKALRMLRETVNESEAAPILKTIFWWCIGVSTASLVMLGSR